uniref:YadA family autotransporter adhesin n=1 Tax=Trinickia soli TaxID=380675 RepID=UPI003CC815E6
MALGSNSTTTANLGLAAYNPGTATLSGTTPVGEVSVGTAGNERRLTNVAAGAAPTDAVNVSQLQSVESQLTQAQSNALQWDPTANGGAGAYNANHGGTGPNTITNVAPGSLTSTSTDAVNGSQLFTTNQNVSNLTTSLNTTNQNVTNLGNSLNTTNQNVTNLATTVSNIQNGAGIKYFHADSTAADSQATATDSVAIGPLAVASGMDSLAAANGAQAQATNAMALGSLSTVSVAGGVAIGSGAVSDRPLASSQGSIAAGSHSIPFNTTDATLLGAVSFGNSAAGSQTYRQLTNVADGTAQNDAVTVRQLSGALQAFAVTSTRYFHANSTAADSLAVGAESVAVGPTTVVNGDNGVGVGNGATVGQSAPGGVAIGEAANSGQADAIALGSGSTANGAQSIAQGANANAGFAGGVAIGSGATSSAVDAIALGAGSAASSANSLALGSNARATAANSVALGSNSTTTANLGLAAYNPGTAALSGTTPVGEVSVGSAGNERRLTNVAAGAAATDAVNVSQLQSVESQVTQVQSSALQWDPTANGGAGAYNANHGGTGPNTITNVAPGALNSTSTDAVNGSQLFTTNQNVSNLTTTLTGIQNGAGIKYFHADSTAADSQATGTDSVAIGPLAVASGADSLAAANGAQAQATNAMALGSLSTVSVAGGVAIGSGSVSDRTLASSQGSIAAGSHAIPFNTTDATLLGAVSFGNSAAGSQTYRQLTNVADGTAQNDAVTVRQLSGALQSFSVTPTLYFHANSTAADSLAVGAQSIAVGPTTVVNGDNGVGVGNGAIVGQNAPGGVAIGEAANSGQADAIALGSGSTANGAQSIAQGANANAGFAGGVAIGSGATSSAVDAIALGAGSKASFANSLALGSGASATFANSVALGAGSSTTIGALTNYVAYGLSSPQTSMGEVNVGGRQITGLAAGRLGTDAVNVSQLQAVQQQLTAMIATGGNFSSSSNSGGNSGTPASSTGANSSAGGSGAVASGSSSTAVGNNAQASASGSTAVGVGSSATGSGSTAIGSGSNDGGRADVVAVGSSTSTRQVINVSAGTAPTDAVNVQQLNQTLSQANTYTDNQIAGVRNSLDSYRRDADGGVATAMAVAGLPQPTGPGRSMVAIAGSVYRGQSGQALGVSTISENDHWVYKASVSTNTRGSYGAVVGAGYQW